MTEHPLPAICLSVGTGLGGSERCLLDFAMLAPELGIRVTVLVPRDGPFREALAAGGVSVRVAPAPLSLLEQSQQPDKDLDPLALGAGLVSWARAISRGIDAAGGRGALLYSNGFKAHLATLLLPSHRRVWHLHEFAPARGAGLWRALARMAPHGVIANSHAVAASWDAGTTVVHNGVDTALYRPAPRSGWLHDLVGIPRAERIVGMPAAFARWKGQLLTIEAFERVAPALPDVHLAIIGGPIYDTTAERGYAQELVRRVGLSPAKDHIHFARFQPEPWRIYPELDVVLHASLTPEPFGRVIIEAMASGVPVIAADAGGPREIIEPGVTGWLVQPGRADAYAAAIQHALDAGRKDERARMVEAARRVVEDRFTSRRFSEGVAAALRRAAGPAPTAP